MIYENERFFRCEKSRKCPSLVHYTLLKIRHKRTRRSKWKNDRGNGLLKSQKLNVKKRVNRQISKCKYRITTVKQVNLKTKRKNEALRKKTWMVLTSSTRNASRSNNTPNSKTKHQIAAAGLKNVPAEIKKGYFCVMH